MGRIFRTIGDFLMLHTILQLRPGWKATVDLITLEHSIVLLANLIG